MKGGMKKELYELKQHTYFQSIFTYFMLKISYICGSCFILGALSVKFPQMLIVYDDENDC